MEFLIEFILDLFIDGTMEILPNRKVPKWIRYTLGILAVTLIGAVIIGIFVLGGFLMKDNVWIGLLFEAIGLVFLVGFIYKCIKIKRKMQK